MDTDLLHDLTLNETDVDGAIRRFSGNEDLYRSCLKAFLDDPTIYALAETIENRHWDDAFTAAHALKGLAGNMGFVPLFHATGELVMLIRAGRIIEVDDSFQQVRRCYNEIAFVLRRNGDVL